MIIHLFIISYFHIFTINYTYSCTVVYEKFKAKGNSYLNNGLRMAPTCTKYRSIFVWFMTMQGKQILARAILKSKRKLGVTTHFLETIIKQHYSKKQYLKIQSNLLRFFFSNSSFF